MQDQHRIAPPRKCAGGAFLWKKLVEAARVIA